MLIHRFTLITLASYCLIGLALTQASAQSLKGLEGLEGIIQSPDDAKPVVNTELISAGDEVLLNIRVEIPAGWYTYSTTPGGFGSTIIKVTKAHGLEEVDKGFKADHPPKKEYSDITNTTLEKYTGQVTWSKRYKLTGSPSDVLVEGKMNYQVCNNVCKPMVENFALKLGDITADTKTASKKQNLFEQMVQPVRKPGADPEPIEFQIQLIPLKADSIAQLKNGDEALLSVIALPKKHWHIFALTQDPEMFGKPTTITLEQLIGLEAFDPEFMPDEAPEIEKPLENTIQQVHYDKIMWSRKFRVTDAGAIAVKGQINYQICKEGQCRPDLTVPFELGTVTAQQTVVPVATAKASAPPADVAPVETANEKVASTGASSLTSQGLLPFLGLAIASGFLALLTPCVFPMVPITISFFMKQSESEHHRPVLMASIYCLSIIATFTIPGVLIAALFGGVQLNVIANNPWLNLGIASVLVFFGLNLLGLFEIRVPSWLLTWSAGREGQGGVIGVIFMALTFTLVSFTCTFAFVGLLLAMAARGQYYWPVIGMLAFSSAFALPFFFLALFPSMLKKLPKSGGWMNTVKVIMGILEIGAALKFLSVADLGWNPVPLIFDFSLTMSIWIVLSIAAGMYLLGLFRFAHDTPRDNTPVPQFIFAMVFLALATYLSVGVFAPKPPKGLIWDQIVAFAPPSFDANTKENLGPTLKHHDLEYALDVNQAVKYAAEKNQLLFFDFTGVNCINCRLMEKKFEAKSIHDRLEKLIRVQLYTDSVPTIADRNYRNQLLETNKTLQEDWFQDVSLPAYAVVSPDGKTILSSFKGIEGDFVQFLDEGIRKWEQHDQNPRLTMNRLQ